MLASSACDRHSIAACYSSVLVERRKADRCESLCNGRQEPPSFFFRTAMKIDVNFSIAYFVQHAQCRVKKRKWGGKEIHMRIASKYLSILFIFIFMCILTVP